MSELREYVVTTSGIENTDSVWDDLLSSGPTPDTIPNRIVEVANERPINERNTSYLLTEEEASELKKDPRVEDVADPSLFIPRHFAFQDTNFDKTATSSGTRSNWGLLRHTKTNNIYGTNTADPGGTYDYVLDGTGVDVVIIDSGIQADHPEFQDANGVSRVQQINWFTASGVSGTMPTAHYTDYDGHGTHVAGTVAGKTFGWAKNAHIYSIKLNGLEGTPDPNVGINVADAMDCLLGWHLAKTNGRPTVLNNSWGYSIYWSTTQNGFTFSGSAPFYTINGGQYRGTPWAGSARDTAKGHTGSLLAANLYSFPYRVSSVDADIALLITNGIIVCNAAGNSSMKIDTDSGGSDSNNYISATTIGNVYYHRGSSPSCGAYKGFEIGSVGPGNIAGVETRNDFSNAGPAVEIYAAGGNIISATSNVNKFSTAPYFGNASFVQTSISGTSMASPQIAGMCALLLQAHPDWTPNQVVNWMVSNSKNFLYNTGQNNDYTSSTSLFGGSPNIAYFPMNGQKKYQMIG